MESLEICVYWQMKRSKAYFDRALFRQFNKLLFFYLLCINFKEFLIVELFIS